MTLLEFPIGIANFGQRIDLSDRDFKAAGGHQPGKLCEHVRSRAFMVPFRFLNPRARKDYTIPLILTR
jgi:hypothetical protein